MVEKFGSLLLGLAAFTGALACKEEENPPDECDRERPDQCPEGTVCVQAFSHLACTRRCEADDDCPEGQVCDWGGSASCAQCFDEFKICQQPGTGDTK